MDDELKGILTFMTLGFTLVITWILVIAWVSTWT